MIASICEKRIIEATLDITDDKRIFKIGGGSGTLCCLLLEDNIKYSATDVVKNLKGHSAKIFFINHPEIKAAKMWGGHLWSHSYYMGTVGNMSKETVRQYIQNQYTK